MTSEDIDNVQANISLLFSRIASLEEEVKGRLQSLETKVADLAAKAG